MRRALVPFAVLSLLLLSCEPDVVIEVVDDDADGYDAEEDCDDQDPQVFPGAEELCDGIDNDCDGVIDDRAGDASTWYADNDGDTFGSDFDTIVACDQPAGYVATAGDCDDGDDDNHPDADEICDDADNDCDGYIDEDDAADALEWFVDDDGDGYGSGDEPAYACTEPAGHAAYDGDCDDEDPAVHPGAPEFDCTDPTDYNCDGSTGGVDADSDGFAACEDCDDSDDEISPDGEELCDDVDNDCNGVIDDGASDAPTWYADADGDTYGGDNLVLVQCDQPPGYLPTATDCDDLDAATNPGAAEVCDGADNDCDSIVDEGTGDVWYADDDGDGYGDATSTTTACEQPTGYVANDGDCDDSVASTSPASFEVCDGVDNDCDGSVDEDDATDTTTWYLDNDLDGYGVTDATTIACDEPFGFADNADDCDDDDDDSTTLLEDADCDTWLTAEDCDDNDPTSTTIYDDADCDGVELIDDCDDNDPTSTIVATAGDCDGTVTADDCDDSDPTSTVLADDGDCDTFLGAVDDCDDTNPSIFPGAPETPGDGVDSDCDGFDDPQNFSGVIEMTSSGAVNGYSGGPWGPLNGGGRAASRLILTASCVNPQIALFQDPAGDSSIAGAYFILDEAGNELASSAFQTYSGCSNCWLPHPGRLSVTLLPGQYYWIGLANNSNGDMCCPQVYMDTTPRTEGIATFDNPREDFPPSPAVGLPANAATWQNRWRIDCE